MKRLIIVVPVYKTELNAHERASLLQLFRVCGKYPVCFFHPEGLDCSYYKELAPPKTNFLAFHPKYFKDLDTYSDLMISVDFYRKFQDYEFMLIYQPDAFIFKDDLEYWMEQDYDYIGAPFFFYYITKRTEAKYGGVGNGGFSLRKISSMVRILHSFKRFYSRADIDELKAGKNWRGRLYYELYYQLGWIGLVNNTFHWFNGYKGYEDFFWGVYAGPKFSWMKFPPYEVALRFSFEFNCEKLYADNQQQLPTGCHRWWGEDKDFWRPIMKEYSIQL